MTQGHELPKSVSDGIIDCFHEYSDVLKPALAMVESVAQEFPGPVLNEIRAVFDHISRCFTPGRTEEDCLNEIRKGRGHLIRAVLDCYKALMISYEERVERFYSQYKDVNIAVVSDGRFLPELTRLHDNAKSLAIAARKAESVAFPDKEMAFSHYQETILAYNEIIRHIQNHSDGLANARQYARDMSRANYKFAIISAVLGTIFGIIATMIINHWDDIIASLFAA